MTQIEALLELNLFYAYLFCTRIVAVLLQMQSQKEKANHLAFDLYYNPCIYTRGGISHIPTFHSHLKRLDLE